MGLPDTACVVYRLSQAAYRPLFETVWGQQAFDITWPHDVERICSTPAGAAVFGGSATPLHLTQVDRDRANATYDQYALSITAYERSADVSAFSSKFDVYLAGTYTLTEKEQRGYELFRGKAQCNTCHLDGTENSQTRITAANAASLAPLFTDLTSANLGLPRNPQNPFYFQNVADAFGFTPNAAGPDFTDLGVGLFLRSASGTNATAQLRSVAQQAEAAQIIDGPTLESATDHSAILRWTTNTRGGPAVHYGAVQYGTDPQHLKQTAKSPNRWNTNLPYVRYRVRIDDLQPSTTYCYAVDIVRADGTSIGV